MTDGILPVTLFADFTSPFCFVTESGLAGVAQRRAIDLRPRAFELYPAPYPLPGGGHDPADLERVAPLAAELEIVLAPPTFLPRTRKAHEATRFAMERGLGVAMRRALYIGYWTEGHDIGRIDVLMEIAAELGMEPIELKIALDIDRFREEVVADEELAHRLRVRQVPTIYLGTGPSARILEGARGLAALDEAVIGG